MPKMTRTSVGRLSPASALARVSISGAAIAISAFPSLGLDPDPARALVREGRAGPVHHCFGAVLVRREQRKVDCPPGHLCLLALDRLAPEHLHDGGPAADHGHRPLVL